MDGIRVIAEGLAQRPRPEAPTRLELHLFKLNSPVYYPVFGNTFQKLVGFWIDIKERGRVSPTFRARTNEAPY